MKKLVLPESRSNSSQASNAGVPSRTKKLDAAALPGVAVRRLVRRSARDFGEARPLQGAGARPNGEGTSFLFLLFLSLYLLLYG
ncbi:hypothetical protein [Microvirga pakistanensis]|uniref:hypothetical protein n=1 Tax=Microvirga pakistanensis TaxID=1682650 RepID=UPI0010690E12|nr:hypothetical protein [Microvirga pakistanensis]